MSEDYFGDENIAEELKRKVSQQAALAKELSEQLALERRLSGARNSTVELKDYLYRKGSLLGWKKRWFSLEGDTLSRFNSHTSEKARGGLRLKSNFVISFDNDKNRKVNGLPIYVFSIVNGKKRKYFGALSEKKRDVWTTALTNSLAAVKAKEKVLVLLCVQGLPLALPILF